MPIIRAFEFHRVLLRHICRNKFSIHIVSRLFSIYLFIVNNFKCNYFTIWNLCLPMLKLSLVIVGNLQERATSIWLNTVLPLFQIYVHVGLFCIYNVWDVYKISNGLEWLFNGHDFVLWPLYDPLLAYFTCVCALLHNLFIFCIPFWV